MKTKSINVNITPTQAQDIADALYGVAERQPCNEQYADHCRDMADDLLDFIADDANYAAPYLLSEAVPERQPFGRWARINLARHRRQGEAK